MALYLVETVSIFRLRYLVDTSNPDYAKDTVVMGENYDFSQKHLDEIILDCREVTSDEAKRLYKDDNGHEPYLDLSKYIINT